MKKPAQLFIAVAALALASPFTAQADEVSDGDAVFAAKCVVCHNTDSAEQKIGPGLAGIKDGTLPSGKDATDENLMTIVNDGGNGMPAFASLLSDEEKAQVIAYMKTL